MKNDATVTTRGLFCGIIINKKRKTPYFKAATTLLQATFVAKVII